ncbi:hypothetical protein HaLaN_31276, partial [Haematococcus lacustris]
MVEDSQCMPAVQQGMGVCKDRENLARGHCWSGLSKLWTAQPTHLSPDTAGSASLAASQGVALGVEGNMLLSVLPQAYCGVQPRTSFRGGGHQPAWAPAAAG